jgi:hypothetical protein
MIKKDVAGRDSAGNRLADKKKAFSTATPEEGARLIRAFVAVKDPRIRKAIIALVENLSS